MPKLIIISNRLPITVSKAGDKISYSPSSGGLATALSSVDNIQEKLWIGWPGIAEDDLTNQEKKEITKELLKQNCVPVFLSEKQIKEFYLGFCNGTLWPLFHYFSLYTEYEDRYWQAYKKINQQFCNVTIKYAGKDSLIWVHDYHLMLLPQELRRKLKEQKIGFFLHVPFPSFEIFRLLPYRKELLNGLLGADLLGFHVYDYARHFLSSTSRLLGYEHKLGTILVKDHKVKVDAFPIGIDYKKFANASKLKPVKNEIKALKAITKKQKVIISIDRLDYTKGILQRLKAYQMFLQKNPQFHKKVMMILLAVPSRTGVNAYADLRRNVEQLISRINGEYSSVNWTPVHYLFRSVPFEQVAAFYNVGDIALITPLRDGMNLVAKEFIASKQRNPGVLILSEMAGAASELSEAITVNPNDKVDIAGAIKQAIEMSSIEQKSRMKHMQKRISQYDVSSWASDFIRALREIKSNKKKTPLLIGAGEINKIHNDFQKAKNRLLFLDYDGTLVEFSSDPSAVSPSKKLINLIQKLASKENCEVVIVSGRDRHTLEKWLGHLPVSLIAEHGAWIKSKKRWNTELTRKQDWKKSLQPILVYFTDRTPNSFVEEKEFSLVWHYRKVEKSLADVRTQELKEELNYLTNTLNLGVYEGSKILEIKPTNINKGDAVRKWFKDRPLDFVMGIGDDYTDEDLFSALPKKAISIRVGIGNSCAKFRIRGVDQVLSLLEKLAN